MCAPTAIVLFAAGGRREKARSAGQRGLYQPSLFSCLKANMLAVEMSQSAKCMLCKHNYLSLDPYF